MLIKEFETLSQFNVNIKWIHLYLILHDVRNGIRDKITLNKAKDVALEIKSINHYLYYIAWGEIMAAEGDFEKSIDILKDTIMTHQNQVHAYIRLYRIIALTGKKLDLFIMFKKIYLFIRDSREFAEKYSEIRYRLM